ncbi:MAG: hypothetical protein BWK80_05885 [Desulfobacteraceae bacterium IS3]|nr:MAG: hypothetical protein BWK80_05885 [Desulfobacteraceae bacterium IS3]
MAEIASKADTAYKIVKKYMLGAAAAGLIPFPLIDMAALAGIQLKMLHSLSKIYDVEFSENIGKSLIASLLGGGIPLSFSFNIAGWLKAAPFYGFIGGILGTSVFGGASTYAIGKVFVQHFESGGTLLTFDPEKMRAYYTREFEKGKEEIRKNFAGVKP